MGLECGLQVVLAVCVVGGCAEAWCAGPGWRRMWCPGAVPGVVTGRSAALLVCACTGAMPGAPTGPQGWTRPAHTLHHDLQPSASPGSNHLPPVPLPPLHAMPLTPLPLPPPLLQVKLMGTFDGWTRGCDLSAEDVTTDSVFSCYSAELLLLPGTYRVKLLVDGDWRLASCWPTEPDEEGNTVNVLTVE